MPSDPYDAIHSFWGEELDDQLIDRIAHAPKSHLEAFLEYYPTGGSSPLPVLRPGHIRPVVSTSTVDRVDRVTPFQSVVPTLMLYAHELVIDDPLPHLLLEHVEVTPSPTKLAETLTLLQVLQPLFDQDLLYFGPVSSAKRHPSAEPFTVKGWETLRALLEDPDTPFGASVKDLAQSFTGSFFIVGAELTGAEAVLRMLSEDVGVHLANETRFDGRVTPLFRSRIEVAAHEAIGGKLILKDRRLAALASLAVPGFGRASKDLVTVRRDSDTFADWREALAATLDHCQAGLLSGDASVRTAARVDFVDGLVPYRDRLQREVEHSSALRSLGIGLKEFGVGAVTAAAGFWAGDFLPAALASGTAGAVAIGATEYLDRRREVAKKSGALKLATALLKETERQACG